MAEEILNLEVKSNVKGVTKDVDTLTDAVESTNTAYEKLNKTVKDTNTSHTDSNKEIMRGIENFRVFGVSIRSVRTNLKLLSLVSKRLFTVIRSGIASTGIGLLVLAIVAIVTAMKNTMAGGKAFKVMMKAIGVVTTAITDSLEILGDAMLSVFGFDSSTDAAVTAAENLEQAYKDLGREMDKITLRDALNSKEKLKNKKIIDDQTKSEEDRMAALKANGIIDINNNHQTLVALKKTLAADKEAIKLKKDKIAEMKSERSTRHGMSEDEKEAGNELIELEKKKNKTRIDLAKNRFDKFVIQEKVVADFHAIKQTQIDEDNKASADQAKANEKWFQDREKQLNREKALLQEVIDIETDRLNNQIIDSAKLLDDFYESEKTQRVQEKNAIIDKWNFAIETEKEGYAKTLANLLDSGMEKEQAEKEASATLIALKESRDAELEAADEKHNQIAIDNAEKKRLKILAIDEAMAKSKQDMTSAIGSSIGALGSLMEEGSDAAKALALTEIAINTGVGFVQGLDIAQKSAKALGPAGIYVFPAFYATQIAAVLGAAAQAKAILGAGGTTAGPDPSSATPPAPQMMSGAFELSGGQELEPARAYVVSDDITNNQNKLAIIRRRATI